MAISLDQIAAAAEQRKLEQQRESVAQMADEIERIKAEDWKPPFDEHEYTPEATVPDDWLLREAFEKARAKQSLAEEPKADEAQAWYTVEDTD